MLKPMRAINKALKITSLYASRSENFNKGNKKSIDSCVVFFSRS